MIRVTIDLQCLIADCGQDDSGHDRSPLSDGGFILPDPLCSVKQNANKVGKETSTVNWSEIVERQIVEAQERGEFDDLPGKGKPLDLMENPFADPGWRVAYKILQDRGFTLDWIELDQEIRAELEACREQLLQSRRWYERSMAQLEHQESCWAEKERTRVQCTWERALETFAEKVAQINEKIELLNLKVPLVNLQRLKISIDEEKRKLDIGDGGIK
jgi:DnaJ family protein C protein 28